MILFMLITNCGRREWKYEDHMLVCRTFEGDVMICKQVNFHGDEDFTSHGIRSLSRHNRMHTCLVHMLPNFQ